VAPPVRIVPLGGLGEIGMNCMAIECDGRIAVVDCGILFPNEPIGVDVIAPDLSWLRERRAQVGAVFLTHGHEDHIGSLPFLLRDVRAPVYGTPFTLALLRPRLEEAGVAADLRLVAPGQAREAGEGSPISARFFSVTHSIPDACGLAFTTPQGTLLHSGDFKIDPTPVRGPRMDLGAVEAAARGGVRLLLSDSTNAERAGTSLSEAQVQPALEEAFESAGGRVFVACFASNVHRIQGVVNAARAFGRRIATSATWSSRAGCRWAPARPGSCLRASCACSPPGPRASRAARWPGWRGASTRSSRSPPATWSSSPRASSRETRWRWGRC
jgi:ribonuclease J